jgi:hypothetical protein
MNVSALHDLVGGSRANFKTFNAQEAEKHGKQI